MRLIAGLGNPGPEYVYTRHNVGFMALDFLLSRYGAGDVGIKYDSQFVLHEARGERVAFIKPLRYMNLSGTPIRRAMESLGVAPEELLVMHDDIDIPEWTVRYKTSGGHGGHNGIRSIIDELGSGDFDRIRIGVGRPPEGVSATDHVLGDFQPEDEGHLMETLDKAAELVENRFLAKVINGG